MKATTFFRNVLVMVVLVGMIKVSGVGDFLADLVEDPGGNIPTVSVEK